MNFFTETYRGAQGLKFSETKGACDLAYKALLGEEYEFPDGKIWEILELIQNPSGLRAIVLQAKNDSWIVLAYKGTDLKNTPQDLGVDLIQEHGFIPSQYNEAAQIGARLKQRFGNNLRLTGHSLGGGLATFSSLVNKIPTTTINPAPLAVKTVLRFGSLAQCYTWITNYISNGVEFISHDGVNLTLGYFAPGLLTRFAIPKEALPKPQLIVVGERIPVNGGGKPLVNYYWDHMLSDTAPEIPSPKILGKSLNSPPAKFPVKTPEWIQPPPF